MPATTMKVMQCDPVPPKNPAVPQPAAVTIAAPGTAANAKGQSLPLRRHHFWLPRFPVLLRPHRRHLRGRRLRPQVRRGLERQKAKG